MTERMRRVNESVRQVLAETGDGEEVLVADVDLAEVDRWRKAFPVLADRRL